MYKFLTVILLSIALLIPSVALADIKTHGLTASQRADLEAAAASIRADNAKDTDFNFSTAEPERIQQYAEIGQAVASSLGAAAKELGIAVNDFIGITLPLTIVMWRSFVRWYRTKKGKIEKRIMGIRHHNDGDHIAGFVCLNIAFLVGIIIQLLCI